MRQLILKNKQNDCDIRLSKYLGSISSKKSTYLFRNSCCLCKDFQKTFFRAASQKEKKQTVQCYEKQRTDIIT